MNKVLWVSTWCWVEEAQLVMHSQSSSKTESPTVNTCMWTLQSCVCLQKAIKDNAKAKKITTLKQQHDAESEQHGCSRFMTWGFYDDGTPAVCLTQGEFIRAGFGLGLIQAGVWVCCWEPWTAGGLFWKYTHIGIQLWISKRNQELYLCQLQTTQPRWLPTSKGGEAHTHIDTYDEAQKDTKFIFECGDLKIPVYYWLEKACVGVNPWKQKQYVFSHGYY